MSAADQCGVLGPWGATCTQPAGHQYSHYSGRTDSSWQDEWRDEIPPSGGGTLDEYWNDVCPCGHTWDEHNFDVGCIAEWEYDGPDPGIASKEGCMCQLAHVEGSRR